MTERLDRMEALLESTQQNLDRTTAQQAKNTEEIDILLGAVATTEANVRKLTEKATYTNTLFETLRAEAQADRQETRQLWNDAVTQMEKDREANRTSAQADRQEMRQLWNDAVTQMDQDREAARASAEADRQKSDVRFNEALGRIDAQQEVIQRLMIELINTNRDATKLRDRVESLEQAS
ncbi:MAG: hypothetical protein WA949_21880 [Phormidesmis sp.]